MIDRLHSPRCILPAQALGIALRTHTMYDGLLLPHRFAEPREKCLVVAQLHDADAAAGAFGVLLLILATIARELRKLVVGLLEAPLMRRQALRKAFFGVLDDVLDGLEAFGAGPALRHFAGSPATCPS